MDTICDIGIQFFRYVVLFCHVPCMSRSLYAYARYGTLTPYGIQPAICEISGALGGYVGIWWF